MEEQTVNDELTFEASDFEPVANDSETEQADEVSSSAVEETGEPSTSEETTSDESAVETTTQTGDAIDEFLAKKGIDPSDPDAIRKVAKMYQDVEKGFYAKSQEKAQLERKLSETRVAPQSADAGQEALSQIRSMQVQMNVERWKAQHNISPEVEQKMVEFVSQPITDANGQIQYQQNGEPFTKGMLVSNGALSLDEVYRLVGADNVQVDNLKETLRAEVRKEMEARQAAKRPSANATDSTQFAKPQSKDVFLDALMGDLN